MAKSVGMAKRLLLHIERSQQSFELAAIQSRFLDAL